MVECKLAKIDTIILSVTCHSLRNIPPIIHIPPISIHEFSKPYQLLFLEFESLVKCKIWVEKNHSIILSDTCHGLENFPSLIYIPSYPFVKLSFFEFESFVKCQIWIVKKIHSTILSVTCHSLNNFPHLNTSPWIHSWVFETLQVIVSWVWVICKRLNVNCIKIHSIILSLTCHGFRNFPQLIHFPLFPFIIFETLQLIISWVWVICKKLNVNWKKITE